MSPQTTANILYTHTGKHKEKINYDQRSVAAPARAEEDTLVVTHAENVSEFPEAGVAFHGSLFPHETHRFSTADLHRTKTTVCVSLTALKQEDSELPVFRNDYFNAHHITHRLKTLDSILNLSSVGILFPAC